MAGPIARINPLHRSMASMHLTKDGKPFYLDKDGNKLSISTMTTYLGNNIGTNFGRIAHLNGKRRGHVKNSQSLPTYSNSSLVYKLMNT